MKIAIVMPVFNEEKHIENVLIGLSKQKLPVIVVNDGSKDKSKAITEKLASRYPLITSLSHSVNLGKGSAMKTGAEYAFSKGFDAIIFMDSDGQHAVSDLSKFVEKLNTNKFDLVFGSRNLNLGVPFIRYIGNKVASVFVSLLFGIYVSDLISGYRAITSKAYKKIKWQSQGYGVETEMVIRAKKANLKYCEIAVETIYFDEFKGVSILDAFNVFLNVLYWRLKI